MQERRFLRISSPSAFNPPPLSAFTLTRSPRPSLCLPPTLSLPSPDPLFASPLPSLCLPPTLS